MICYFRESLKPSIKVEIEQQNWESMDFKEMVQKAINTEANVDLKSNIMAQNSHIHYPRGHCPSNSTVSKVQTQGTTGKESKSEEAKPKELKLAEGKNPTPLRSKSTEPGKSSRIDKRREYFKKKWNRKNNIPVTKDNANTIEVGEKKKRDDRGDGSCYNCQKKGHFLKNYSEPPKNKCWSRQSPC